MSELGKECFIILSFCISPSWPTEKRKTLSGVSTKYVHIGNIWIGSTQLPCFMLNTAINCNQVEWNWKFLFLPDKERNEKQVY